MIAASPPFATPVIENPLFSVILGTFQSTISL